MSILRRKLLHDLAEWALISSSPNPKIYKEIIRQLIQFTLLNLLWSEKELTLVNPNCEAWFSSFQKCRGVARIVLWDGIGCGPIRDLFKKGLGDVYSDKLYTFTHINLPYPEGK